MTEWTAETIKEAYPYLYETHLHTSQGSACGKAEGAQMARACKAAGYTGIFVTDHNWGGNTAVDRSLPWEEWTAEFAKGYREARAEGDRLGTRASCDGRIGCPFHYDFRRRDSVSEEAG